MNTVTDHEKAAALLDQIGDNLDELGRLQSGRFARFFTLRKQRRLLIETDALMSQLGDLTGQPHQPAELYVRRNPELYGHPLFWLLVQFGLGVWNASQMVRALSDGHYWLAACNLLGVVVTAMWRTPPWRLAIRGRYNDEHTTAK
jgi:hypothetical protein